MSMRSLHRSVLVFFPVLRNLRGAMTTSDISKRAGQLHQHQAVIAHALRQHAGIPYEVEQKVCRDCRTVLDERTVRRAAA